MLDCLSSSRACRTLCHRSGSCFIVPPAKWNPKFAVPEDMKFSPATQNITQLRQRTRTTSQFIASLAAYYHQNQLPLPTMEQVSVIGRAINLATLYQEVELRGGRSRVDMKRSWPPVAVAMGFREQDAKELQRAYVMYLDSYAKSVCDDQPTSSTEIAHDPAKCHSCNGLGHPELLISCAGCNRECHTFCMCPPRESVAR